LTKKEYVDKLEKSVFDSESNVKVDVTMSNQDWKGNKCSFCTTVTYGEEKTETTDDIYELVRDIKKSVEEMQRKFRALELYGCY